MRYSSKRAGSRRYAGRAPARPSRVWADVSTQFALDVTATGTATLLQLQAPSDLSNLTADPPEDLTVLRIRGSFNCRLSGTANWTLALLVQDTSWTPSSTFTADADKRVLWSRTFDALSNVIHEWRAPGYLMFDTAGTVQLVSQPDVTMLDISPKVRIEAGKALYLVAYENSGAAGLQVGSEEMRVLFQRTGRR